MTDEYQVRDRKIVDQVVDIVVAYVSNNHVSVSDLPALIDTVRGSLASLDYDGKQPASDALLRATEAQIRKSITANALISFIDGKPYKTLKRHLRTHGFDQDAYRERYGLPANYPMVATSYSTLRRELSRNLRAKSAGRAE